VRILPSTSLWAGLSAREAIESSELHQMNALSPTSHGFRLAFRRPAISLAEIAWRWSFVGAVWVLGIMFLFVYMDSLPVTRADRLLLRIGQPELVARAIDRIFEGSALRFTEAAILLAIGLTAAWVMLASLGRAATVGSIIDEFGLNRAAKETGVLLSLFGLNFLRSVLTLAALASVVGAMLIASRFWALTHVPAAEASQLFFLLLFGISMAWVALNWLLSASAIFVVADGRRALAAIADTMRLCRQRPGPVFSAGALFGTAHVAALVLAAGAAFMALGALGSIPASFVWLTQLILIVAYCAIADFLYIGRLAAYVLITRGEEGAAILEPAMVPILRPSDACSAVDQDELILGDVALPAS
jgi:hypothetical protein